MCADGICCGVIILMKKLRLRETSDLPESGEQVQRLTQDSLPLQIERPTAPQPLLGSLLLTAQASGRLPSPPQLLQWLALGCLPGHLLSDKRVDKAHILPREPSSFHVQRTFSSRDCEPLSGPQASSPDSHFLVRTSFLCVFNDVVSTPHNTAEPG